MSESYGQTPSSLYNIEAILDDRGLEGHIDGAKPEPVFADIQQPTEQERAAIEKWQTDDRKAQMTINCQSMIHRRFIYQVLVQLSTFGTELS